MTSMKKIFVLLFLFISPFFLFPQSNSCFSRLRNYQTPQHFRLGSMGGFLTLSEINAQLDSMHLLYPSLITQKQNIDTFHSIEGRPMYWIEISDHPGLVTGKPQLMFTALHHAMEPMGMQQLIYFMWYLLENYGNNQEVKYLVDHIDFYIVPVVNPDGYA
jgi:carboxypeptidase T